MQTSRRSSGRKSRGVAPSASDAMGRPRRCSPAFGTRCGVPPKKRRGALARGAFMRDNGVHGRWSFGHKIIFRTPKDLASHLPSIELGDRVAAQDLDSLKEVVTANFGQELKASRASAHPTNPLSACGVPARKRLQQSPETTRGDVYQQACCKAPTACSTASLTCCVAPTLGTASGSPSSAPHADLALSAGHVGGVGLLRSTSRGGPSLLQRRT